MALLCLASCKKSDPPPALTIAGINPTHGPRDTTVIITGTGFSTTMANNQVFFNGRQAVVTSATPTQLSATVPVQAGTGQIAVTVNGANVAGPVFTYEYTDVQVTTLAGSGHPGTQDGTGTQAYFNGPIDIAVDTAGNLYVADYYGNSIRKITPGGVVSTFVGGQPGDQEGTGTNAQMRLPAGITIDAAGNLYVAEYAGNRIRKITPAGVTTTLAGSPIPGQADGTGAAALFSAPWGITIDAAGNLYVTENNSRIRKVTPAGVVTTFAGTTQPGFANGPAANAQFMTPKGMVFDGAGNLFVGDGNNHLIREITPGGIVSTLAGSAAGFADGTAANAKFNYPIGIAKDAAGDLLVADMANNRIRLITPSGMVSTLAGGASGYADGNKATALFSSPTALNVDRKGVIYVAEYGNLRIRKIVRE